MPRPTRRGEAICQPKSIPWDKPASGIIPQAPAGVLLWQHAEQMDWHDFLEQLTAADPRYSCSVRNVRDVVKRRVARREAFPQRATPANVNEWAPPPAPTGPSDMDLLGALAGDPEAAIPVPEPEPPPIERPAYKSDPVVWCRERNVQIDTKTEGLIPFVPYSWQEDVMRKFWEGGTYFVEKSRQEGFSTCILVAACHALLYSQEVLGTPLTMPIVADKEGTALNLLKIVKTVLHNADLTDEERARLSNTDPESGTKKVSNVTPKGTSWIEAYTSTGSAARSYAFNAFLLEEFAWSDKAKAIWESVRPVVRDVPRGRGWVVSTPNGQSFHADLCDDAEKYGAIYLPMDWKIRPERIGTGWREQRDIELGEDLAAQECDLKRIGAGERLVDVAAVEAHAAKVVWYGPKPLVGHLYSKALDTAGPGQDLDVFTVVDITTIPAQVVFQREFPNVGSEEKLVRVLALHRQWPGKLYIDGTNDATFPELVSNRARHVIAVRFRGAQEEKVDIDHAARLQWRHIERQRMSASFKNALEFGDLLLHKKNFPKLWEAIETAQYARVREKDDRVEHSGKAKRRGKHPDYWDSAMLAALDVRPGVRRKARPAPAPRGLRAEGPGQKLREMEGREQSTTTRRGSNWRGRKF